ncbi:MAG: DeoR/GlpR transcriptional regulator [Pirellulales bacterium]|nr:DeoR/GlpR transcriptional regulator [Pirellulales bacterium]
MKQAARQARIREMIVRNGECSVEELAAELDVSGMTIRRDLQALSEQGQVIRTHGGATLGERISFEFAFLKRSRENRMAKEAIAAAAFHLAQGCRSIMLDGSTTTLAIARRLHGMTGLTVVTTSLPAAAELQYEQGIDVLLPGGYVRPASPDLTGSLAEANLESLRAEIAFLGADGIDLEGSVYAHPPDTTLVLVKMAASASRVYVAADHTKLGRTALRRFGQLRNWAGLITDSDADPEILDRLREAHVNVIVAKHEETINNHVQV